MKYQDMTREELLAELLKLRQEQIDFRETQEYFQLIFNTSPDAALISRLKDGLVVEVNDGFSKISGFRREETIGKLTTGLMIWKNPEARQELIDILVKEGSCENFETVFLRKNGSSFFGLVSAKTFMLQGEKHVFSITRDITGRKQAEEALKIILLKYQVLFDLFPLGITISDATGKITETNQIAETLLGISREEQEKRKIGGQEWRIIRPDGSIMADSEFASVRALVEKRPVTNVEMGIVKDDNRITWLNVSATPIPTDGNGVAIVYGDITEQKKAEAELKIKNEQLKELNATKDKFFSIIAHDLISPFNIILGFSNALKKEGRDLDIDSILNYAGIINTSAQNTYRLLENLLDWARMQQGGIQFEPGVLLFNSLLQPELENLKYAADQKKITLRNDSKKEIMITADEKMISTVLRNLISIVR